VLDDVDRRAAAAPLQRAHARQQFIDVEGLDQVIVGAGVQPRDALRRGVARREHQHRRGAAAGAQVAQHLQPVHAGQAQVEDHEVERAGAQRGERLAPVGHPFSGVARALERVAYTAAQELVVLHQQYAHFSARILRLARGKLGEQRLDLPAPAFVGERPVGAGGRL
jgi:D-alanyl-D-alanine carboxypeptidase/D-alanyl-D-alanine-endopeptidase (penicillin-binding protein 4)